MNEKLNNNPGLQEPDLGNRGHIYHYVEQERRAQDAQWGGPDHDAEHDLDDWLDFISKQIRRLRNKNDDGVLSAQEEAERLIKIAALAIAAYEQIHRP